MNLSIMNKFFSFSFLFFLAVVLFSSLSSACLTPVLGGDIFINESTSLCQGSYILEDDYAYMNSNNEGVFIINQSDVLFDCNNSIIGGNSTYFFLVTHGGLSNITVKNCFVSDYFGGIKLDSDDSFIYDSSFSNIQEAGDGNVFGEAIQVSSTNVVLDNITVTSSHRGIDFGYSGSVSNCNISLINQTALRISQNSNSLIQNTILSNSETGLYLYQGSGVNITNITILSNEYGVELQGTDYSFISNSNISNNQKGIFFLEGYGELGNTIYNNYFSNNLIHINSSDQLTNNFNTSMLTSVNIIGGSSIGGNYYDNYMGQDTTGDGIGQTPYQIITTSGTLYDYLPLTNNYSAPILTKSINISLLNGIEFDEGSDVQINISFENFSSPTNLSVNFGDGNLTLYESVSSPFYVNHSYSDNAMFNLSVVGVDSSGSDSTSDLIKVVNSIPFNVGEVHTVGQGSDFYFQPTFSDNGSNDTHTAFVFWGDGSNSSNTVVTGSNSINHLYATDGTYLINFSVIDDDLGSSDWYSFSVSLTDENFTLLQDQTINLTQNASVELFIDHIVTNDVNISWGDGSFTFDSSESNGSTYQHNFSSTGMYLVNATLSGCKSGSICVVAQDYFSSVTIQVQGCGDGIVQSWEECDGSNFNSQTCSDFGHNRGSLSCSSSCIIDSSACYTSSGGSSGGSSHTTPIENIVDDEVNLSEIINQTLNFTLDENTSIVLNETSFEDMNITFLNETVLVNETNTSVTLQVQLQNLFDNLESSYFPWEHFVLKSKLQELFSKLVNSFSQNTDSNIFINSNSTNSNSFLDDIPCEENWSCSEWSTCTLNDEGNGFNSRTCIDKNSCGTQINSPLTSKNCVYHVQDNFSYLDQLKSLFQRLNIPSLESELLAKQEDSGCDNSYNPVCGDNAVTYDNICSIKEAGEHILYLGACSSDNVEQSDDPSLDVDCDDQNSCTRDYYEDNSCHNVYRPDGYVCNTDMVCYDHKCISQESALAQYESEQDAQSRNSGRSRGGRVR